MPRRPELCPIRNSPSCLGGLGGGILPNWQGACQRHSDERRAPAGINAFLLLFTGFSITPCVGATEPGCDSGFQYSEVAAMKITDTRVVLHDDEKLRAFVSITLDNSIVIRGLKVIRGNKGLFVAMPNRRRPDGSFQDIAHPIHPQARQWLERIVLDEYTRAVRRERGEEDEPLGIDEPSTMQTPGLSSSRTYDFPAN